MEFVAAEGPLGGQTPSSAVQTVRDPFLLGSWVDKGSLHLNPSRGCCPVLGVDYGLHMPWLRTDLQYCLAFRGRGFEIRRLCWRQRLGYETLESPSGSEPKG